jgi:tetratricopeptide (TPR) repeat protein
MSQLFAALGDDVRAIEASRNALEIARQVEIEQEAEFALIYLGQSLARLGRWDEAVRAYQDALDARSDQEWQSLDALAGLADVALQRGDPAQAMGYIEPILAYLSQQGIQGLDNPLLIYWICYRVLRSAQDPRGQEILTIAVRTLQAKADALDDPAIKQSFLENVPANAALLDAWKTIPFL